MQEASSKLQVLNLAKPINYDISKPGGANACVFTFMGCGLPPATGILSKFLLTLGSICFKAGLLDACLNDSTSRTGKIPALFSAGIPLTARNVVIMIPEKVIKLVVYLNVCFIIQVASTSIQKYLEK